MTQNPMTEALAAVNKALDFLGGDVNERPGDMGIVAAKATLRSLRAAIESQARATAPAGLDVEDVRAVLAAWGMEANVTFSRDVYERGEEAVKRLRAALVASGETDR